MSTFTEQQPNTPDYLGALGLERAPFLDNIDDHFFYADPALIQRLDLLQHLTRFGDMLLCITGPLGSGKSTLLRQFLLRGNTTWRSCLIDASKINQPHELLARLAECFDLDMTAAPERLKADLVRYCEVLQHNSQQAVIVIDDAHLLQDPVLKALLGLGGDARETLKLMRVLMFSETDLEQRFIRAGLHSPQQPLLHHLDIPRFDDQQTAAYLMYRLAAAGFSGDSPFSLTEIRAMHKAAESLPGKLNTLAHETLIERANRMAARKKMRLDPTHPAAPPTTSRSLTRRPLLALIGTALILGAIGSYFIQSDDQIQGPDGTSTEQRLSLDTEPAPIPAAPLEIAQSTAPSAQPATQPDVQIEAGQVTQSTAEASQPKILEPAPIILQPSENKDISDASKPAAPASSSASPAPAASPDIAPAPITPVTVDANVAAKTETTTIPPVAKVAELVPETPPSPAATREGISPGGQAAVAVPAMPQTENQKPLENAEESTPAKETRETTSDAATAQTSSQTDSTGTLGAAWLLERPAAHYTLQLLGVRSETSLQKFIVQAQLPGPIAYFHTEYKGGDWYVLVQGDYPTMAAARSAINSLPAAVRKSKPWPRTFATVHADIQKIAP